jgi:hypothetical protein
VGNLFLDIYALYKNQIPQYYYYYYFHLFLYIERDREKLPGKRFDHSWSHLIQQPYP